MLHHIWQDTIAFSVDQLLIGIGWHAVEKAADTYIRWSGPETTSTIHFQVRRDQANRLNMTIHRAADEKILTTLRLEADGVPLSITLGQGREPAYITTVLPADSGKPVNQETILSIVLPRTLEAAKALADPRDKRNLGIALERIDIFPLARPLFTAQKYQDPTPFDGNTYIKYNPGVRDAVLYGLNTSAYDYFLKHNRKNPETAYTLQPDFDERPGDLYDILRDDMRQDCARLGEKFQDEIKLLREMVYRQGDMIRELRNAGDVTK